MKEIGDHKFEENAENERHTGAHPHVDGADVGGLWT